jgi:hypothetical protein
MKHEDIKVGMRVRIRQWDDMAREFGANQCGEILCMYHFGDRMKHLCGRTATISSIDGYQVLMSNWSDESGDDMDWLYSADMLEPADSFEIPPPPDLGELHGVKLPAWMWCRNWKRKAYVVGRDVCGSQYSEMSMGTMSGLPVDSLEPYTGQDKIDIEELKRLARLV